MRDAFSFKYLGILVALLAAPVAAAFSDFEAPDSRVPYTCTFHWFTLDDGSTIGLDVIRSDASPKPEQAAVRGLRVFHVRKGGESQSPRKLVYTAPASGWSSSFGPERPELPESGKTPFLARGRGWVMAHVNLAELGQTVEPGDITSAAFDLDVVPEDGVEPKLNGDLLKGINGLGEKALFLEAADYVRVRTRGRFVLDGVEHSVVESLGPASVHFGEFLPDYGYLVTLPGSAAEASILVSSVHGDALKIHRPFDSAFTYSYGDGKVASRTLRITGKPRNGVIPIGLGRKIVLSEMAPARHELLGVETWTATARATYVENLFPWQWFKARKVDLGTVVLDYRGRYFLDGLAAAVSR